MTVQTVRQRCGTAIARSWDDPSSRLLMAQLSMAGAAFVANLLAARGLGPSGRGELALLLQVAYMSSLGLLLGIDKSVVAQYQGVAAATVTRAVLRLLAVPTAVGLVLAVAFALLPLPGLGPWQLRFALAAGFAVVNAFVRAVRAIAIASGRTGEYLRCTLLSQGILLALLLTLLLVGRPADSAIWVAAYLAAGTCANGYVLVRWRLLPEPVLGDGGERIRRARREGLVLLPAALSHSGMLRLDRLLLPLMASTAALGVYAGVGTMTELLSWPLVAFADSRTGAWRRSADRGDLAVRPVLVRVAAYALGVGAVFTAGLTYLVEPLLGPDYASAVALVPVLVAGTAIFGTARVLSALLIARRRSALASGAEIIGFLVSVALFVVLIPRYEAMGAALGSLGGYFACLTTAAAMLALARPGSGDGPSDREARSRP